MKKNLIFICLLTCLLTLAGCACQHEWTEANCTNASVCAKCGETEGEPLGHSWSDATCTEAKRCRVCGGTEGEALGHTPGQWQESTDFVTANVVKSRDCMVCGEQTDRETVPITTLLGGGMFLFTPEEFMERFVSIAGDMGLEVSYSFVDADSGIMTVVNCGNKQAFVQFFRTGAVSLTAEETDTAEVWCVSFIAIGESEALLRHSLFMTCDPTLTEETAFDLDMVITTTYLNSASAGEIFGYHQQNDLLYETCYVAEGELGQSYSMTISNIYASDFR